MHAQALFFGLSVALCLPHHTQGFATFSLSYMGRNMRTAAAHPQKTQLPWPGGWLACPGSLLLLNENHQGGWEKEAGNL